MKKNFSTIGLLAILIHALFLQPSVADFRNLFHRTDRSTDIPRPATKKKKSLMKTIYITKSGTYDFKNVLHVWKGKKWGKDKEYGPPALHVRVSNVTIKNFACSGAPDGIHVGSLPWSGANAVRKHRKVSNVKFVNLQVLNIREDAFTCQKETSKVTIQDSHFWDAADKAIQNDHGKDLRILNSGFYKCVRAIRWKANTSGEVIGCRFLKCKTPVKADGDSWPKDSKGSRRRKSGNVRVKVSNCFIYDASTAFEAGRNSRIELNNNVLQKVSRERRTENGGKVVGE